MNYKRLALVVGITVWLPMSVFLAHLIPDTDWPTAIISGPLLFGLIPGLLLGIVGQMLSLLWWWLREKPDPAVAPGMPLETGKIYRAHLAGNPKCRCPYCTYGRKERPEMVALERWHRLWEKGIDPDTHKCENTWVKESETHSRWGCRPCMEVEKELAE